MPLLAVVLTRAGWAPRRRHRVIAIAIAIGLYALSTITALPIAITR